MSAVDTAFFVAGKRKNFQLVELFYKNFWEVIKLKTMTKKMILASVAVGVLTPFTGGGRPLPTLNL